MWLVGLVEVYDIYYLLSLGSETCSDFNIEMGH